MIESASIFHSRDLAQITEQMLSRLQEALAPAMPPMSVMEFAGQVILPDGRTEGQVYVPETHQCQLTVLQAADSGLYSEICILKPTQDGGTLVMLVILLHRVTQMHHTVILAYPTADDAKDQWRMKVEPILKAQGGYEPPDGGGKRGGVARVRKFPGGGLFVIRSAGGRGESSQASITADAIGSDELDDWPGSHVRERFGERVTEGRQPLAVDASTLKLDDGHSLILGRWEDGTRTVLHYRCQSCGFYAPLEFYDNDGKPRVTYEGTGRREVMASARYACTHCGGIWNEHDRQLALTEYLEVHGSQSVVHCVDDGQVVGCRVIGEHPDTDRYSLRWSRMESPRHSLGRIAWEFYKAKGSLRSRGDHGPMRRFHHDWLTMEYHDDADADGKPLRVTRDLLQRISERSEIGAPANHKEKDGDSWHIAEPPEWAEFISIAADVQKGGQRAPGRIYWMALAMASNNRWAIVGWGTVILAEIGRWPTTEELHTGLDRMRDQLEEFYEDDHRVPVARKSVDVGDRQNEIVEWISDNRQWRAVKGDGEHVKMKADRKYIRNKRALIKPAPYRDLENTLYCRWQSDGRWWLDFISATTVQRAVQGSFLAEDGEPGSATLPQGVTKLDAMVTHLCSRAWIVDKNGVERWSKKAEDRKYHDEWQRRNDYLSCANYAWAEGIHWMHCNKEHKKMPKRKYGVVRKDTL